jgi:HTH-type transcriptional regulator, competence development regulator
MEIKNQNISDEDTFGVLIRQARKNKGLSQRELAEILGLDFTYLSKLENDRAKYAPKEEIIRELARHLELNQEELIFLSGRIPQQEEDTLKQHYKEMPSLFRYMRENPEWAQKVLQEVMEGEK